MRLSKHVHAIGFTLLLAACATPADHGAVAPAEQRNTKALKTAMLDAGGEPVDAPANQWDLQVSLRAIPGAFGGAPFATHSMLIPIHIGESFALPMSELEASMTQLAQRASEQTVASGISVEPADTRFARVATFFYDSGSGRDVMGAGFLDAVTRETVTLSYFDRPCKVRGTVREGALQISVAMDVPAAGFHWVRTDTTDPTHWKMVREDPDATLWYVTRQAGPGS